MPEPNYTITITEAERTAMAKVLGGLVTKLINAPLQIDSPLSPPASPAAAQQPSPIEARVRWARDRKGNEVPNPKDCIEQSVHIWKCVQVPAKSAGKPDYYKVTWEIPNGQGHTDANCFDAQLFPWLIAAQGKPTATIYTVRNGNYLNIVGIRA